MLVTAATCSGVIPDKLTEIEVDASFAKPSKLLIDATLAALVITADPETESTLLIALATAVSCASLMLVITTSVVAVVSIFASKLSICALVKVLLMLAVPEILPTTLSNAAPSATACNCARVIPVAVTVMIGLAVVTAEIADENSARFAAFRR